MPKRKTSLRKAPKKGTLSQAKTKCWAAFSYLKKLEYSWDGESLRCYTCDKIIKIGTHDCHASHCLPKGGYPGLYFHENNVRPSCSRCNLWLEGNVAVFVNRLIEEIGQEEYDKMYAERHNQIKLTKKDYEEMTEKFKQRIREIIS